MDRVMTSQVEYKYDIFISYSHTDRKWVQDQLLPMLEQAGLTICLDYRDFEIGAPSLVNMERAVEESQHTLLVLTPAWIESQWTDFESLLAATRDPTGRQRKLLPLMLRPCKLPTRIAMLTYADLTRPSNRANQFSHLIRQLRDTATKMPASTNTLFPFIAGPPILHPRYFFGRERELRRLFNLWRRPPLQNAAIVGPRRSGKTSLLLYLKNIISTPPEQLRPNQRTSPLQESESYRWIFADFQDPRLGTREGLLRYLLESLKLSVPPHCDLDHFMELVSHGLRSPTVILLDEIGIALQRYPELDNFFWEGLRSLATTQVGGNLAFVLTAHEPPDQLAHHSDFSSPFFNIFAYTVSLGPLTEPEARTLIASSPISFSPKDVDWILVQSGRWPLLLQVLCRERLFALENRENGDIWRAEGIRQIEPFRYLLE
jgi:hypothetical protein